MDVLVDTNLLVRGLETDHPHHPLVAPAFSELTFQGHRLCLVPQVLYEFYVVCTRPPGEYGGLGLSAQDGVAAVRRAEAVLHLLSDTPQVYTNWQSTIEANGIVGKRAHDARLVAAMRVHGVPAILTFNGRDFSRYPEVQVLAPEELATAWAKRPT